MAQKNKIGGETLKKNKKNSIPDLSLNNIEIIAVANSKKI
jgi:hypothetical protein